MLKVSAPCKINLSLVVETKREDGFHNIKTIFQTINIFDKIKIFEGETLSVSCPFIEEKENIVYKACLSLLKYTKKEDKARIVIEKHIPIGGGLGGGSSDCAETLIALNKFWALSLSKDELKNIGASLGSDVPFFFERGTCFGNGKGERIVRLPQIPPCFFLLVFFPFPVVTKEVYESWKIKKTHYNIENLILAIKEGNLFDIAKHLYNDLEEITIKRYPEIKEMKAYLIKEGALNALMTGSGPTIFGIFKSLKDARYVKQKLDLAGIKAKIAKPI